MPVFNQLSLPTTLPPIAQTIKPQSQAQPSIITDDKGNTIPAPTPTPSQQMGGVSTQSPASTGKVIGGKMPGTPGRPVTKGTKSAYNKRADSTVSSAELRKADFIKLPSDVSGTNCSNCRFEKDSVCENPAIKGQPVSKLNCCALWDAEGTERPWQQEDSYKSACSYTTKATKKKSKKMASNIDLSTYIGYLAASKA